MTKDKLHLLLVDDDKDDLLLLGEALSASGLHTIDSLTSGTEALKKLMQAIDLPDVIVTDLTMPIMPGLELIDRIKEVPALSGIPIIVFSTSCHPKEIEAARTLGVLGYIIKPFDLGGFRMVADAIHTKLLQPDGSISVPHPDFKWF